MFHSGKYPSTFFTHANSHLNRVHGIHEARMIYAGIEERKEKHGEGSRARARATRRTRIAPNGALRKKS
jgi:hypothetical protein